MMKQKKIAGSFCCMQVNQSVSKFGFKVPGFARTISQSTSSLKVIQKSIFVLSQSAPIRRQKRPVWASSLPESFNTTMAVVKKEIPCLNLFRIVGWICCQHNLDP